MALGATAEARVDPDAVIEAPVVSVKTAKAAPSAVQQRAVHTADAMSALVNLGYGQGDAASAVATVVSGTPEAETAAIIRAALKLLAPKG